LTDTVLAGHTGLRVRFGAKNGLIHRPFQAPLMRPAEPGKFALRAGFGKGLSETKPCLRKVALIHSSLPLELAAVPPPLISESVL
jgi:hypothetical protein